MQMTNGAAILGADLIRVHYTTLHVHQTGSGFPELDSEARRNSVSTTWRVRLATGCPARQRDEFRADWNWNFHTKS